MKNILNAISQSVSLAIIIWVIMGAIYTKDWTYVTMLASVMFFGAVIGGTSAIYQYSSWPLLVKVSVHFTVSLLAFILMGYHNHWIPLDASILVGACLQFALIFFAIWTCYYFYNRHKINQINHYLKKKKD
ncbi:MULTISPECIES: DUF3021 domain-containing protein [Aerococcus]|uniref:DUF3021 domain-containing protein n=1 Tax=Aerococcus loyolae TaxID=2976809 RepID=A0ABT4BXI8_9LACT|nr:MULTISPECIES: DUF3021 domain-containing protein [Aerococcus]KAA9220758.1 DUF3021 domain-containing protein [Aerococcus loyolae]KAA9265706.1 DUF3021 domain-containing protein [Aerococcus loyolae]MCY3024979.1 DUF3021 domain-containing protein [Aerococcus loyolae]MCY3026965.1 DUF3021 domain-containing protein [Aerococcus loyolae]MCY3028549.1 DUF3021 domain-containing protein [Aerococcus loyolae]